MPYDFNKSPEQQEYRAHGPVPDGSIVLLQIKINPPYKPVSNKYPLIGVTPNGLYQLNVTYTVQFGKYQGVWWYDTMLLPVGQQKIQLTEKQVTACNISESKLRGIIEAFRGLSSKDKSEIACRKRSINNWEDINEMKFPARLGINPQPREYKGNLYWKNRISFVITAEQPEYENVMYGGEIINENGAIVGDATAMPPSYSPQGGHEADPFMQNNEITDRHFDNMANRQSDPLDDVPF